MRNVSQRVGNFFLQLKSTLRARSMSEPESGKGNVNTVYFGNQARGNTRISRTAEFVYDE